MNNKTRKIAFLGIILAIALILSYVEALLPPIWAAVPGVKIGLPNIIIIFLLYKCSLKDAVLVSLVRLILVSLLFGNFMMFLYSLAGAVLSLLIMAILKKTDFLSIIGVSVAGAVAHNLGQIIAAVILLQTNEIGYYMIILAITGTLAGIFVGIIGSLVIKKTENVII